MLIEELRKHIEVGDFAAALALSNDRAKDVAAFERDAHAESTAFEDVATVAEMKFYVSENVAARKLLDPYKAHVQDSGFRKSISARAQLQLAEYFYSLDTQESYEEAAHVATRVLNEATHANNPIAIGEAAYYLMRICRRLHRYADVTTEMRRAIEAFSIAKWATTDSHRVRLWRIGSVYLVAGFTEWRKGDVANAVVQLETAKLLLKDSPDKLARANVMHTMGTLRRSQSAYQQAETLLKHSLERYMEVGNRLNVARVYTDLGRTYLGLREWKKAEDCFDNSDQQSGGSVRQKAENALWRSWLALSDGPYNNPARASQLAAVAAAASSYSLEIEGLIAQGYAAVAQGDRIAAGVAFKRALQNAHVDGKHRVNALLSRAEFLCEFATRRDFREAGRLLNTAFEDIARLSISSRFLTDKAQDVTKKLKGHPDRVFIRTVEDLQRDMRGPSISAFDEWLFRVSEQAASDPKERAKLLGMKEVDSLRRRANRLKHSNSKARQAPSHRRRR